MEEKIPNYLKRAIEEDDEQITEEELKESLNIVNSDPTDYEDEDEEYFEEEEYHESYINSSSFDTFQCCYNDFLRWKESVLFADWDQYPALIQQDLYQKFSVLLSSLEYLHNYSEDYEEC